MLCFLETETTKNPRYPEGPARHLDVLRQKLSLPPHCLETIFDSQLPSPKLSPKIPPKLSLAHKRGHFSSKITPAVRAIARQLRDRNCLAAIFVRDIKMSLLAHWVFFNAKSLGKFKERIHKSFLESRQGKNWISIANGCGTNSSKVSNRGGSSGGFSRSGLVRPDLSFLVLFGTFPIFSRFPRFVRGFS